MHIIESINTVGVEIDGLQCKVGNAYKHIAKGKKGACTILNQRNQ